MSESTTRFGFALLCALGMLAIGLAAILEIVRFRRNASRANAVARAKTSSGVSNSAGGMNAFGASEPGASVVGNLVSPRQFRLRLFSAALWMLILGALYYAVTVQWPVRRGAIATAAEIEQARRFAMTLLCAFAGMFVGFGLLAWDMIQLARERQTQTARLQQDRADLARSEAARIQNFLEQNAVSPNASPGVASQNASPGGAAQAAVSLPTASDEIATTGSGDQPASSSPGAL